MGKSLIAFVGGRTVAMILITAALIAGFTLPFFSIPTLIFIVLGMIGMWLLNKFTSKDTLSVS